MRNEMCSKRKLAIAMLLVAIHSICLAQDQQALVEADLNRPASIPTDFFLLNEPAPLLEGTRGAGESYSLSPTVGDASSYYYLSSAIAPTTHIFDGIDESGGGNYFGSAGGSIIVTETIIPQGGGVDRFIVQVITVNSSQTLEAWIHSSWAGNGFTKWRLDVGSTIGGTNPIQFVSPITVLGSGFVVFDTGGTSMGAFDLSADTSTATSLSGVAILSNSGFDVAGVPVAAIQMYWDVTSSGSDDLAVPVVDATGGTYLPGSPLDVFVVVENIGTNPSGTGSFGIYASTDTSITESDHSLGSFAVPPIDPGNYIAGDAPAAIPGDLTNGEYYIGVILDYPDADQGNNINHDEVPIKVSDSPEIRIRPLTLDFSDLYSPVIPDTAGQQPTITPFEMTQTILPQLMDKAENDGSVRVIVGLDVQIQPDGLLPEAGRQAQRQDIQSRGNQLISALQGYDFQENARFRFIPYLALTLDADALLYLSGLSLVSSIQEDKQSFPSLASSNPVIGSPLAWAEGYDGSGQVVAVLDTGVDKTHPWFASSGSKIAGGNKVVSEACYSSTTADTFSLCPGGVSSSTAPGSGINCDLSISGCDHGTHVAGIAAGNDGLGPNFGVARGADIIALQVFSGVNDQDYCNPWPAPCTTSFDTDSIRALERVYELRGDFDIAAANLSFGGGQFFNQATCDAANPANKAAIDTLRSVNIATVISAGNEGLRDSIGAPGCISSAISAGATADTDDVASFSNIYPQLHLLAPGVDITSSVPGGTATWPGTSMSAPHVAAAWAILKQVDPGASVSQILTSLQNTGTLVDDQRSGGTASNVPRINVDLAMGEPRTTFGIFNDGAAVLTISSIVPQTSAAWISWTPQASFDIPAGGLKVVSVNIDFANAPPGLSQTRLLINSNDSGNSPYPGGVLVNVTASGITEPEFHSNPPANATLAFGDQFELIESDPKLVQVSNLGNVNLTLGCALSGADISSFRINACPTPIAPAGMEDISVSCQPASLGTKTATLVVTSNDADEATVNFYLTCTGTVPPACYSLSRTHSGAGSDPVATPANSSPCTSGDYIAGELIDFKASPDSGWSVGSWTGTGNNGTTSSNNQVLMPANHHSVSVNYVNVPARTLQFTFCSNATSAEARGFITFNDALLSNPFSGGLIIPGPEVLDLSVTVTGATSGNGTFTLNDFDQVAWDSNLAALNFNQEMVGQPTAGSPWGTTPSEGEAGDFNLHFFSPAAPSGTWWFTLSADEGQADPMVIRSMVPGLPVNGTASCESGSELKNLSTRADVGTGPDIAIAGFITSGNAEKCVVIRGRGPSMNVSGVPLLMDPNLTLYSGQTVIDSNDDWQDQSDPNNRTIIENLGLAPVDFRESAIYKCLPEGPFTALLRGGNAGTGVGIVEVFDADDGSSILENISTRARVGSGPLVTIGGFIIEETFKSPAGSQEGGSTGAKPMRILVRGRGPTVGVPQGVTRLSNPKLRLYQLLPDNTNVLLMENDNWGDAPNASEIAASGEAPGDPSEAAILMMLEPGVYTGILDGVFGATGSGIIEVIDLTGGQ